MRKLTLLAGIALSLAGAPAIACDWHRMGGPQRFNPLAQYQPAALPGIGEPPETARDEPAPAEPVQPEPLLRVATEPAPAAGKTAPSAADILR